MASCASEVIFPPFAYCDSVVVKPQGISVLNPIFLNCSINVDVPIFNAAFAKYILSEYISAFFKFATPPYVARVVTLKFPQLESFCQLVPLFPKLSSAANLFVVNPIAPITGLNEEPGAQVAWYLQ